MMRPVHINADESDFVGNGDKGRFLLLPGSRDRAATIARSFEEHTVKAHARGHDLHTGVLVRAGQRIDVGVISTGMGCPSVDLIVPELICLGARVLLRVGTSGSLQPHIHTGDIVVATAAVRDESTSDNYLPRGFPAVASWSLLNAIQRAVTDRAPESSAPVHFGPVHTKDSLYARQLERGPLAEEHKRYNELLACAGVCASEMECAHLFVLAQLGAFEAGKHPVDAGALLAVIGERNQPFADSPRAPEVVQRAIELAFDTFVELAGP
jgi:uridine phosphorylase